MRRDLRAIGGLPTLLKLLADPEAGIRSRAAGIVAASAQSNPPVQQASGIPFEPQPRAQALTGNYMYRPASLAPWRPGL